MDYDRRMIKTEYTVHMQKFQSCHTHEKNNSKFKKVHYYKDIYIR